MTPEELDAVFAELDTERDERRRMAWEGRRVLAGRWHWPDGVLAECERVERLHPGWSPFWRPADERTGQPAGYTARRYEHWGEPGVAGETPDELAAAIETAPPRRGLGDITPLKPLKSD